MPLQLSRLRSGMTCARYSMSRAGHAPQASNGEPGPNIDAGIHTETGDRASQSILWMALMNVYRAGLRVNSFFALFGPFGNPPARPAMA
jgi:hypothetical protein